MGGNNSPKIFPESVVKGHPHPFYKCKESLGAEDFPSVDKRCFLCYTGFNEHLGRIKNEKKTAILVTHDLSEAISIGKRIIVLSKRPGTVKKEIKVVFRDEFGRERNDYTPMQARNAPEFHEYFNLIWKELNENGA